MPPARRLAPDHIHDGQLLELGAIPEADGRMTLLRNDDHLLRRFGALEGLRLEPDVSFAVQRLIADEIWCLLEGSAAVRLEDRRRDSPTMGIVEEHTVERPTRLLIPFGVAAEVRAGEGGAFLVRLMTHDLEEDPPLSPGVSDGGA